MIFIIQTYALDTKNHIIYQNILERWLNRWINDGEIDGYIDG